MFQPGIIALLIFVATYAALVLRNLFKTGVTIWLILLLGASGMIGLGVITPSKAYASINMDVLSFLFGMFVIVSSLDRAGVLEIFATKLLSISSSPQKITFLIFLGFGFLSAFLMNDTIALIGTPIVISIAKKKGMNPRVLLLALAFSITIGSVPTPMGNPQNLLVALGSGMDIPVLVFLKYLSIPTIVNILITSAFFLFISKGQNFTNSSTPKLELKDRKFAIVSVLITIFTLGTMLAVNIADSLGIKSYLGISEVSLIGAALMLLFSRKPKEILESVDWGIMVMFVSLFIIMESLSLNGVTSSISNSLPHLNSSSQSASLIPVIISSVVLSQVLSNVPMVALYIPILKSYGFGPSDSMIWTALASSSTLAGNLTILGAASNLIIIEEAEKEGISISFFEFLRVGVVVTTINIAVLYLFLLFGL